MLRYAEKLRERSSQRLLRSSKTLQDKRTKEKSYSTKLVNDTLQANQSSCDKAVNGFLKDISVWVKVWKERFQQGQDIFTGNEVDYSFAYHCCTTCCLRIVLSADLPCDRSSLANLGTCSRQSHRGLLERTVELSRFSSSPRSSLRATWTASRSPRR